MGRRTSPRSTSRSSSARSPPPASTGTGCVGSSPSEGRARRVKAAGTRAILATCLPAAAAILVFGTLYGAAARTIMGVPLTLASSLLVFSGALQFALLALLSAGATTLPLVLIAVMLNLRHL